MTGHKLKIMDEIELFKQEKPEEMYIDEKRFTEILKPNKHAPENIRSNTHEKQTHT